MPDTRTAQQIAEALGVTRQAVQTRSVKESWPVAGARPGRGGGKLFDLGALPKDIRSKVRLAEAREADAAPVRVAGKARPVALDDRRRRVAAAKLDLVGLYLEWLDSHGRSEADRQAFVVAFRAGTWPELLKLIGPKVSWKSIERWKVASRREGNLSAVADKRGLARRGQRSLSEDQKQTLIRFALQQGQPSIAAAFREANKALAFEGLEPIGSEATARRFLLRDWMREHFGDWVYVREGAKAWNDKCAFFLERDYDLIEVGDIVVADGHKLNFEIINPWTGTAQRMELVLWYDMKSNFPLGWDIMPSENTQCIAAALRRACIVLGTFPKVAYLDNGRAFRSRYFNGVDLRQTGLGGLFRSLGVQTLFAWPYHGQSKTVERFFGTFAELERWVPSYSGTCIDTKPARMKRGERVHRAIYEASGARPLTLLEAHMATALFFDEYIQRPQKGHLAGRSPWDVFSEGCGPGLDETQLLQLRELMLHTEQRTLTRNGVSLFGRSYYAPELYSRKHPVTVKYDPQEQDDQGDVAWVLVYDERGELLCRADKVRGVHPAARILGDERHQAELAAAIELKKSQERDAADTARTMLQRVVLPETARRMELVATAQPGPRAIEADPPAPTQAEIKRIEDAQEAARQRRASAPAYVPPEQMHEITDQLGKYEYLFNLVHRDGVTLRAADEEFMAQFEASPDYERSAGRYDKLRRVYAQWSNTAN